MKLEPAVFVFLSIAQEMAQRFRVSRERKAFSVHGCLERSHSVEESMAARMGCNLTHIT